MYAGNTVPTEWPKRANRSTYETYAKLPSWHVEEAASLTAGHPAPKPLSEFPSDRRCAGKPKPYEDAKTWGVLLEETGPVGRVISLLARAQGLSNWGFSGSDLYIAPAEFVDFCDKYGVTVPDDLRETVREAFGSKSKAKRKSAEAAPKRLQARYRINALQVARELKEAGARVRLRMFKELMESGFAPTDGTVGRRHLQEYLRKWRRSGPGNGLLRGPLADVLPESGGRPRDGHENDLKRRLPEKYVRILWPDWQASQQTTNTTKAP